MRGRLRAKGSWRGGGGRPFISPNPPSACGPEQGRNRLGTWGHSVTLQEKQDLIKTSGCQEQERARLGHRDLGHHLPVTAQI